MHVAIRILLWVLAVMVVAVASLFLYLQNADLSVYEEPIEKALSDIVGHDVRIDGVFRLNFGDLTSLTAEQVSVTNPGWQPQPSLINIGHLSVTVDFWSFFSGPFIVENLEVRDVDLRLQRNSKSRTNWDTERPAKTDTGPAAFNEDRIAFRQIRVEDFHFELTDPARRRPLNLVVEELTVEPDENRILDLDLNGMVNEFSLLVDGHLGPWENLLTGRDLTANLSLTLGRVGLSVNGFVADLRTLDGVDLTFDLNGPSIDRVADVLGLPPIARGAFQLDGRVHEIDGGNQVRFEGNLGDIGIFAAGEVDRLRDPGASNLQFRFSGPDSKYIAELFGVRNVQSLPFDVGGDLQQSGTRLLFSDTRAQIGDNTVSLDGWLDTNARIPDLELSVEASGPDFSVIGPFANLHGAPAVAFDIDAEIRKVGNTWSFDDVRANVGENRVSTDGVFEGRGSSDSELSFAAGGPDISFLQPMTGLQGLPARPYEISAVISPDSAGMRLSNATGVFGDNRISVDGVIGTAPGLAGTSLSVHAEGPELENVALLTRVPLLPDGPFDADGHIRIEGNRLRIDNTTANVAGMAATATGYIGLKSRKGEFDLSLSAKGPDFADMVNFQWLRRMEGYPFDLNGRIVRRKDRFELNAVNGSIGNLTASMDGQLATVEKTFDLSLNATSPDSEMLGKLIGVMELPAGSFSTDGRIEKSDADLEFSDFQTRIGDYALVADGTLSRAPLSNDSDFRFSLSGPELRQLGLPFGFAALPVKTFSISGEVNGVPRGFAIENLVAQIEDNDISGRFTADLRGKPELSGTISGTYLDLKRPLNQSDIDQAEETAAETESEFFFSDEPLSLGWLDTVNAEVEAEFGTLILRQVDMHEFKIGLRLRDGALVIDPVSFSESEASVSGRLELEPANGSYRLDGEVIADGVHLGLLVGEVQDRATLPPVNGRIEMQGTGVSLHEILANSTGTVSLRQSSGRVRNIGSSQLFGDLVLEVVRTFNPLKKKEAHTNVECAFYDVGIENGVATIQNLAIQTDVLTFLAFGNVNFDNEALSLSIRATPREGIGISLGGVANSFLILRGTLKKPQLKIDPAGSVTTTGVAVATGGISLLAKGLWDRMSAANDICSNSGAEETKQ